MEYLRQVDFAALTATGPAETKNQILLDRSTGSEHYRISCGTAPAGFTEPRHTHPFDLVQYIISGPQDGEIAGTLYQARESSDAAWAPISICISGSKGGHQQANFS